MVVNKSKGSPLKIPVESEFTLIRNPRANKLLSGELPSSINFIGNGQSELSSLEVVI